MASNPVEVLSLVKSRLGLQDANNDGLLEPYVLEIEQRILDYCHIAEVPDGLKFVWSSMSIDLIKSEQQAIPEIAAVSSNGVEAKIGDTTVKESSGGAVGKSSLDAIVLNYRINLHRYRKLRW